MGSRSGVNHWEIELSGVGLFDGQRIPIPKDNEWPPDEYRMPQYPDSMTVYEPTTTIEIRFLVFRIAYIRESGVIVYRECR